MTVGIFTKWEFGWFDEPDSALTKKLDYNPFYPFEPVGHMIFLYSYRSARFREALITCIIALVCCLVFVIVSRTFNELAVIALLLACAALWVVVVYGESRTLILDVKNKLYEFYRGRKLVYRGDYHNIYIRLAGKETGGGAIHYVVLIGGYMVDSFAICQLSKRRDILGRLARRLAYRLDLNFFVNDDRSRLHVIRHRCPYDVPPDAVTP